MFKKWEIPILVAAFFSFLLANALYFGWVGESREAGIFVGHWVTSILVALTYLKVSTHAQESKADRVLREHSKWYADPADEDVKAYTENRRKPSAPV